MEKSEEKEFITQSQYNQLLENDKNKVQNPKPIVMLHIPNTENIWLLTSVFQENPDVAYGLVLEKGLQPKHQCIWLHDLFANHEEGMEVVREHNFVPNFTIDIYKDFAEKFGTIPSEILRTALPDTSSVKTLAEVEKVFSSIKITSK